MTFVGTIIVACWAILALSWVFGSMFQKPVERKSSVVSNLWQTLLMIIPIILLIGYDIYQPFSIVVLKQSLSFDVLSVILCIMGLIVSIWARITLSTNWSAKVVIKKDHELITHGPYRFVRHPIYSGFLLIFLGTSIAVGRVGGFVGLVLMFLGFYLKLKQEEKLMISHFGKKYIDYMKRTKEFIPGVF